MNCCAKLNIYFESTNFFISILSFLLQKLIFFFSLSPISALHYYILAQKLLYIALGENAQYGFAIRGIIDIGTG